MKNHHLDAASLWKLFEDHLVPALRLSPTDRAVYSYLLRHSVLEGKLRIRFSILSLARGVGLSGDTVRQAVRRLVRQGALILLDRTKDGHAVRVRLPQEILAVRESKIAASSAGRLTPGIGLEQTDFFQTRSLRLAIHRREDGVCFYCLRRLPYRRRCLDHVIPRVRGGRNSYRNLVSCCHQCNSQKGDKRASDFLRSLYRQRCLTAAELSARLRALDSLAAGKLRPTLPTAGAQAPPLKVFTERRASARHLRPAM